MAVKRTNRQGAVAEIAGKRPFKASALSGVEGRSPYEGIMDDADKQNYRAADPSYTVSSYATPIAWHDRKTDQWVMPSTKFSSSTSRHQGVVRNALSHFSDGFDTAREHEESLWKS